MFIYIRGVGFGHPIRVGGRFGISEPLQHRGVVMLDSRGAVASRGHGGS